MTRTRALQSKPKTTTSGNPKPLDFSGLAVFRKTRDETSDKEDTNPTEAELEPLLSSGPSGEAAPGQATAHDAEETHRESTGFKDALASSTGRPLEEPIRTELEGKLGESLEDVQVHTDAPASEAATQIGAEAFTVGRHIYFADGRYAPQSREGRRLLAHEAAHAAQSSAGAGQTSTEGHVSSPGDSTEVEAERFADQFDTDADSDADADAASSPVKERAEQTVHRYPGVVPVAFEEDKKRGIDPGDPASEKVWTKERGYKKNPTATKLSSIVKKGKVGGKFANGKVMYVVDQAGDVWVGHRKGVNMPHPTLIGGKNPQVKAAGMVEIRGGKIVAIDNHSGHFRPPRAALSKASKAFMKLPKDAFKNLQMKSVHFKKDGSEYWKKYRSLRTLKLKKLEVGKAIKRIRMRYKHDPKFRGRIRGAGRGGLGILVAMVVGYFFGKWMAKLEEERIRKDLQKLQPRVERELTKSLESQADDFDALFEKDPKTKIHMNLIYRLIFFRVQDPEDGLEVDYESTELVSAEFSTTSISSGTSFEMVDRENGCGITSREYRQLRVSEELEVGDLYDALGGGK